MRAYSSSCSCAQPRNPMCRSFQSAPVHRVCPGGAGGIGGGQIGGNGQGWPGPSGAGTANSGGAAGGGGYTPGVNNQAAAGGKGIVVIRYKFQ